MCGSVWPRPAPVNSRLWVPDLTILPSPKTGFICVLGRFCHPAGPPGEHDPAGRVGTDVRLHDQKHLCTGFLQAQSCFIILSVPCSFGKSSVGSLPWLFGFHSSPLLKRHITSLSPSMVPRCFHGSPAACVLHCPLDHDAWGLVCITSMPVHKFSFAHSLLCTAPVESHSFKVQLETWTVAASLTEPVLVLLMPCIPTCYTLTVYVLTYVFVQCLSLVLDYQINSLTYCLHTWHLIDT